MGLAFPKTGKRIRTKKATWAAVDKAENATVPERSGWRCEVVTAYISPRGNVCPQRRCENRATQIHHMIGGRGRRGIGESALAERKQHVCDACHLGITGDLGGKKLKRIGGVVPHFTDCYERLR